MRRYFKAIKSIFQKNQDEVIEDASYIPDEESSATIEIKVEKNTGDFNLTVEVVDVSDDTAEVLGLLLYFLNSGGLSSYFTSAYSNWSGEDPKREQFLTQVYYHWLKGKGDFETEYDKLAVNPSHVFNFNSELPKN